MCFFCKILDTEFDSVQSRQVKRTPQDSTNELIIWKRNPLVVSITSVKSKISVSCMHNEQWIFLRELFCIWSDWKSLNGLNFLEHIYSCTSNSGWLSWCTCKNAEMNLICITTNRFNFWIIINGILLGMLDLAWLYFVHTSGPGCSKDG